MNDCELPSFTRCEILYNATNLFTFNYIFVQETVCLRISLASLCNLLQ